MKKAIFILALSCALLSWGVTGHRTCGRIAENHLTPAARAAIHDILGDESIADASTWADEVRSVPEFKNNGPWHYIDLPLGLSFDDFSTQVKGMTQPNAYWAVCKLENDLVSPHTSIEQKAVALKYIIHIVEDLHQPMHVSRAEDKGGNTIQLNYDGQGTNLHALWDSKLIDHGGLNDEQLAAQYDHIPSATIKEWQHASMIQWMWESYQITARLYTEVDQMKNRTVPDAYYDAHIPIVKERIQMAGIRLAGLLNQIFSGHFVAPAVPAVSVAAPAAAPASAASATAPAVVSAASGPYCDKVYGGRYFDNSGMTLLNLGGEYPNQKMTVVIRGEDRSKFKDAPETFYMGKQICVTGKQEMYKGRPEIVVTDPSQITVQ
ncbi:S1/P1 nuclease [Dinghuibacter silviterrae]|uniref:S1/P1 nuclease n=1 Tax=Dinghuibacter silviterrae TaxID=1539049 RepID=A0A4R8DFE2_9BACT|nr:S1/P1 nuclease [Dinghuibacter silviterrae]TDW96309.1 S1/P1 nuclease [Dinghuibacter silviterrae]